MDRKPAAARLLTAALAALALPLAFGGAGAVDLSAIHADRWLAPGADQAYLVEVGRAAFRTPLTLGGQAARAGVACESCHQGGRSNPDFFFPGLSGAPGTADVTSSLFSSHRDDGIDNPKPIPDLGGPKARLKVNQDPASPALKGFIHGLVTEEFDGAEPPPAVLAGLAAYVRALSPAACPPEARRPLRIRDYVEDSRRAAVAAAGALDRGDPAAAAFLIEAARTPLGLIDERFDQPLSARPRAVLKAADLDLAAIAEDVRAHRPHARERLAVWIARSADWAGPVEAAEGQSLFNRDRLAAAGPKP